MKSPKTFSYDHGPRWYGPQYRRSLAIQMDALDIRIHDGKGGAP